MGFLSSNKSALGRPLTGPALSVFARALHVFSNNSVVQQNVPQAKFRIIITANMGRSSLLPEISLLVRYIVVLFAFGAFPNPTWVATWAVFCWCRVGPRHEIYNSNQIYHIKSPKAQDRDCSDWRDTDAIPSMFRVRHVPILITY